MDKQTKLPRIGFMEKFGFGAFSTASNVVFNFKDLFYLFFLTNVMGISIAHAGIITALGIVWDAVNDPLVGYWAVNHRFKNGEQCRPFALWCAVPWAITTVLMFTCFDVAYALKLAIFFDYIKDIVVNVCCKNILLWVSRSPLRWIALSSHELASVFIYF